MSSLSSDLTIASKRWRAPSKEADLSSAMRPFAFDARREPSASQLRVDERAGRRERRVGERPSVLVLHDRVSALQDRFRIVAAERFAHQLESRPPALEQAGGGAVERPSALRQALAAPPQERLDGARQP
ncbi:MAG TPA: hypothetical protein VHT53_09425, partial [Candidatus Elarobacter sp.]|nr:hypothetical protein [Candidatus Elarobacter sp.]